MTEKEIINEFNNGHSRRWIYDEMYRSLMYQKKNNKTLYSLKDSKEILKEAQQEVDRVLIKWYKENISKRRWEAWEKK